MFNSRSARFALRFLCLYLVLFAAVLVQAAAPAWWADKQVLRLDGQQAPVAALDFAAANQGQLKNMAVAAYEHFWDHLESPVRVNGGIGDMTPPPNPAAPEGLWNRAGTGWRLIKLISQWVEVDYDFATGAGTRQVLRRVMNGNVPAVPEAWSPTGTGPRKVAAGANRQDFAVVNQGQLKAVADVFYDRMDEIVGRVWGWGRPWSADGEGAQNSAAANLGHLKSVFSFDLAKNIPPTNLTAVPSGGASIQLSWQAGASAVTSFSIERKTGIGAAAQWVYRTELPVANVLANSTHSWQDTQVFPGVTYSYRVREHFGLQMSSPSNVVVAAIPRESRPHDVPNDPGTDADGDGLTDAYELVLGLNPNDPNDAASSDPDENGYAAIFDYLYPPISGPAGLRITFPDSLVHPKDPDRSKIRVSWDTPSDSAVTGIRVELSYPGQMGGATPIDLGSTTTNTVIENLLSKRRYLVHVTFQASHDRKASAFLAYEVPAIRGLMIRRASAGAAFNGTLVYSNANKTGVPRKMQSYSVVTHRETSETNFFDALHQFVDNSEDWLTDSDRTNTIDFAAASQLDTGENSFQRSYNSTVVETGSESYFFSRDGFTFGTLAGSFQLLESGEYWSLQGGTSSELNSATINATLRAVDLSDALDPNRPYLSVTGSSQYDSPSLTVNGTFSLVDTSSSQMGIWDYTKTDKTVQPPITEEYSIGAGQDEAPGSSPPYKIAPQEFPNGLYPDAVVTGTANSWTQVRNEKYDVGSYTERDEFWTQTVTIDNEFSTSSLINAVASMVPDLNQVPWYHPYLSPVQKTWKPAGSISNDAGMRGFASPVEWSAVAEYVSLDAWSGGESGEEMSYVPSESDGFIPATVGTFLVGDEETDAYMGATEYQYRLYPSAVPYKLTWVEEFTPYQTGACPPNWVPIPQYRLRSFLVNPEDAVTSTFSVQGTAGFDIAQAGNYTIGLASVLFQTGPLGFVSIKNAAIAIVPDSGMIGVVGDFIPSSLGEKGENHFVSPKKTVEIADDYVVFKASGTSQQIFSKLYEWVPVVGGEAIQGDPLGYRVKRDVAQKVEVKIRAKGIGEMISKLNVWIVWCDVEVTPGVAKTINNDSYFGFVTRSSESESKNWRFVFSVKPKQIISDKIGGLDAPDLTGENKRPAPGDGKPWIRPDESADSARYRWDLSRQFQATIRNGSLIPESELVEALRMGLPEYVVKDQPKAVNVPIKFPDDPAEGNDDAPGVAAQECNPYVVHKNPWRPDLDHEIGQISSTDGVAAAFPNIWAKPGRSFADEADFREFARLEIWDGKRSTGRFWFRISDHILWHFYHRVSFDETTENQLIKRWKNGNPASQTGLGNQ